MRDVLIFGGTYDGRTLCTWLLERKRCHVVYASATDYGAALAGSSENLQTVIGPFSDDSKHRLIDSHDFCCIIDATHPFATHISASIDDLAAAYDLDVVRIARETNPNLAGHLERDARTAARYLADRPGNILLTCGSKDLASFTEQIPNFTERLFVRILPDVTSLERTLAAGIPRSHVICMQGPLSVAMNLQTMREYDIAHVVTKDSGRAGGFHEKAEAAREANAELVVIRRPEQKGAVTLEEAKLILEERYGL